MQCSLDHQQNLDADDQLHLEHTALQRTLLGLFQLRNKPCWHAPRPQRQPYLSRTGYQELHMHPMQVMLSNTLNPTKTQQLAHL